MPPAVRVDIEVRPGRAEDASVVAPLMRASGPRAFDYIFGERSSDFLRSCFERDEGLFGCGNHEVAVLEGRPVAVGAFYDGAALRQRSLGTLAAIGRFYGVQAAGVLVRALELESMLPPPATGELYVAHLGVEPALRGRGIMSSMIERQIERGRAEGYAMMTLDVARTNIAMHLYERLGFRVIELRRTTAGRGAARVPDHYRMVRELP
jgi:ribosomal protein S18 acetylase RimI-like enzyme